MKPFIHAKSSAKKFGGDPKDYLDIHDFMDSSKQAIPDVRHRAVFHSAFGCYIVEKVFGHTRINTDGKEYSTRDVAEQHIIEDLGTIPTLERWLSALPIEAWMGRPQTTTKTMPFESPVPLYEKLPRITGPIFPTEPQIRD